MDAPDSAVTPAERPAVIDVFDDVEERRLFATVHGRLFGKGEAVRAGRYVLLRSLGAGAMGEVHLAHDEALDRKVAIKFVHSHLVDARWAERLRREARMLARLTHPNVVHVYEVSELDGRVYLAMEYVPGESLGRWIRRTEPGWGRVLAAYLEAGRGLAAAHGAGVIHRDFKPDNVLRSDDGRVLVADFGLAYVGRDEETAVEHPSAEGGTTEPALSRAGEIKGTPAYMAPEQLEVGLVDARADQFAWCVAVYEGLWGRRPFPERSRPLRLATTARSPLGLAQDRRVPTWIWPILQRGLAYDPEDRWPDMNVLLAELVEVPARQRRRRRRIGTSLALALAGLVGSAGAAWWLEPEIGDACAWTTRELEGVWDEPARVRLQGAFAAVDTSWAEDSAERVTRGLDGWSEAWLSARHALCRGPEEVEVEDPVLRSQAACLAGQRVEVGALVQALQQADEPAVFQATQAIEELPNPRGCSTQWAQGEPPPPPAEVREAVDELAGELAVVDARIRLAKFDEALQALDGLKARLDAAGYEPLLARTEYYRGRAQFGAGMLREGLATLERAVDLAEGARDDRLLASCSRSLAKLGVTRVRDASRGETWLRRAEASRKRLDGGVGTAELLVIRGHLLLLQGDVGAAAEVFRAAIADLEERGAREGLVDARSGLGLTLATQGRLTEALEIFRVAVQESEESFGPRHPGHAQFMNTVGATLVNLGHAKDAEPYLRRAVEIWTASHHEDHPDVGYAKVLLARFAVEAEDFELAERYLDEAARAYRAALPADHVDHGDVASGRATLAYARGNYEAALAAADEAIGIYSRSLSESDIYLAKAHGDRGGVLLSLGRVDEAEQAFQRADAVLGEAADTAPMREPTLFGLAVIAVARGQNDEALRWLAGIETADRPDKELATLRLWSAIALARQGKRAAAAEHFAGAGAALPEATRAGWLQLVGVDDTELNQLR